MARGIQLLLPIQSDELPKERLASRSTHPEDAAGSGSQRSFPEDNPRDRRVDALARDLLAKNRVLGVTAGKERHRKCDAAQALTEARR